MPQINAFILSFGTEITTGQTVDSNSAWLSQRLAEIGIETEGHATAADQLAAVVREIQRACDLAEIVLITGGLGPTQDDLTRMAMAEVAGVPLESRPEMLAGIEAFFLNRGRKMPAANSVQALFPQGSTAIENTCGTAPGIRMRIGRGQVFAMPGVPREMKVMFDRDVLPHLATASGGRCILTSTLYTYGASESAVDESLGVLMARDANPMLGTTASDTIIGVRIVARGATRAEAARLRDEREEEVIRLLGPIVFGRDDSRLSVAVGALLKQHGRTVATAESCTGGLVAAALTDVSGSSAYFLDGLVTYSNEAKMKLLGVPQQVIDAHGAVSAETAREMATRCRQRSATDYAISVTGIAGPEGGTVEKPVGLVYVGVAGNESCDVREYQFGAHLTRQEVRDRTVKAALNQLRRRIMSDVGDETIELPPRVG